MNLKIEKVLQDNVYQVTLAPENWLQQDLDLMTNYGEPMVETGGTTVLVPAFDFPEQPRQIKSGFPYARSIDADGDVDAEGKMNNWVQEMSSRFTVALATLRSSTDTFTGTSYVTI